MENLEKACEDILNGIESGMNRYQFNRLKMIVSKKNKLKSMPTNVELLEYATQHKLLIATSPLLKTKPSRTLSGVSVVAIMAKPAPCPGRCIYCPKGDEAPQSYTGYEPAAMRARLNKFDPYKQVQNRLYQLKIAGHSTDKNELIIMGGTFPALDWAYQEEFVKRAFDGFNGKNSKSLEEAQKINETAKHRVISIIFETRPDWCKKVHINRLLQLGGTRVELGAQSIYDDILKKIKRGHDVKTLIKAIRLLKDSAFKVDLHFMPGLPGSSEERDIKMFKELFENSDFRPDGLKIYPTSVMKGTKLYNMWKKGEYKPITDKYILKVLTEVKGRYIPPYVRIKRISRDIPGNLISAGSLTTNMREVVWKELTKQKLKCRCIRCREIGHQSDKLITLKPRFVIKKYKASKGQEIFISYEDVKQDILFGFLRLRIPDKPFRREITNRNALIRELHVYGLVADIGKGGKVQHKGLGKKLMAKAEKIAKEKYNCNKIVVLAGAGVKRYYSAKCNYKQDGVYMSKML